MSQSPALVCRGGVLTSHVLFVSKPVRVTLDTIGDTDTLTILRRLVITIVWPAHPVQSTINTVRRTSPRSKVGDEENIRARSTSDSIGIEVISCKTGHKNSVVNA